MTRPKALAMGAVGALTDTVSNEPITWTRRDLVLIATTPPTEDRPEAPQGGVHHLIACPTCRARVDETCRTRSGHTTTPHASRLTPRLCPCGELVKPQRRYCDPCRDRIHKANTYAGVVRLRARKAS